MNFSFISTLGNPIDEKTQTESCEQVEVSSYLTKMIEEFENFWKRLGSIWDRDDDISV